MSAAGVHPKLWVRRLQTLPTGKPLALLTNILQKEQSISYQDAVEQLYDRMGYDWHSLVHIFKPSFKMGESIDLFMAKFTFMMQRLLSGRSTIEEMIDQCLMHSCQVF